MINKYYCEECGKELIGRVWSTKSFYSRADGKKIKEEEVVYKCPDIKWWHIISSHTGFFKTFYIKD